MSDTEKAMNSKQAATYLGMSESWLQKERAEGRGPRYLKLGRVMYRKEDLDAYLKTRVRETTDSRREAA